MYEVQLELLLGESYWESFMLGTFCLGIGCNSVSKTFKGHGKNIGMRMVKREEGSKGEARVEENQKEFLSVSVPLGSISDLLGFVGTESSGAMGSSPFWNTAVANELSWTLVILS